MNKNVSKKIIIINGPNLNLTGKREINIYGKISFLDYLDTLRKEFSNCSIEYFQSNIEGEIITEIQNFVGDGIIINAGGYTHTSIAIRDAIQYRTDNSNDENIKIIEVHISNIYAREVFRHQSLLSTACNGTIIGFGLLGYKLAIFSLLCD